MPGSTSVVNGFQDRFKGKTLSNNASLQQFGNGGALAAGGGQIYATTATTGNGADTTEDTLLTWSLPANSLDIKGRCITVQAFGHVTATSATKTIKFYFGSSITQSFAYTTTQTGDWQLNAQIYKSGASTQIALVQWDAGGSTTARTLTVFAGGSAGSETDTAAIVIKVTGQSTAATANLVTLNGFIVDGYN